MKPLISFFVSGEPRAKQSYRSLRRGGGFTPAQVKAWQSDVAWTAQQSMRALGLIDPLTDSLTVKLTFFLKNARRIDLDNLSKAVQDGLNGIVYKDDQQNVCLILDKYICRQRQGVFVQIWKNEREIEVNASQLVGFLPAGSFIGVNYEQALIQQ